MTKITLICMAMISSSSLNASDTPLVRIKLDKLAANGECIPRVSESPESIFSRNRILVSASNKSPVQSEVKTALARVINSIETMGSRRFTAHADAHFIFKPDFGYSYHFPGTREIFIRPGGESSRNVSDKRFGGTNNIAKLTHELAHYISLRDGELIQKRYETAVPTTCFVTKYAAKDRREEFAEVFASFVTRPEFLSQNVSSSCRAARVFMSNMFNEPSVRSESCASRLQSFH